MHRVRVEGFAGPVDGVKGGSHGRLQLLARIDIPSAPALLTVITSLASSLIMAGA